MKGYRGIVPLLSVLMLLATVVHSAGEGEVEVTTVEGQTVKLYKGSHALLIGVSDYTAGWDDLNAIPEELTEVGKSLRKQGFLVEKLPSPNAKQLRDGLQEFLYRYGFNPANRLLVFYSGHGHTEHLYGKRKTGYLVPSDAPDPRIDRIGFLQKALPMEQILTWSRTIAARHVMFLFDSCFSGTVFQAKGNSDPPPYIEKATAKPVREFLTAGNEQELTPSVSIFTPLFAEAFDPGPVDMEKRLKYAKGDMNHDGYITGAELGLYIQQELPKHEPQSPQFGKINDYALSQGDFVFVTPPSPLKVDGLKPTVPVSPPPPPPTPSAADVETALWMKLLSSCKTSACYEAYKQAYPEGRYLSAAEAMIASLEPGIAPRPVAPEPPRMPDPAPAPRLDSPAAIEAGLGLNREERRRIQMALNSLGHAVGTADGIWGGRTRSGIRAWQSGNGKAATGYLDREGYKALLGAWKKRRSERQPFEPEMVDISGGSFLMGDLDGSGKPNEKRVHRVTVRDFRLAKTETTFAQFDACVADGGCSHWPRGDGRGNRPVTHVNWEDIQEYIRWLNRKTGKGYRLPSEAEWEYAARAGSTTRYAFGDAESMLCRFGNFADKSWERKNKICKDGYKFSAPVGSFKPNRWGLYDMHGNVWEWVGDCWHDSYQGAPSNGEGWRTSCYLDFMVARGGAFNAEPRDLRSASRDFNSLADRRYNLGFRLAQGR